MWERLLDRVQERGVALGMVFLDGSNVRAHQKAAGAAKRMARPVRKWLGSAGLCSLHKRIRPSDSAVGQDGDPRVLGLIKGAASSAIFTERLPEHRSTVRPSSSHRPQTSEGRRVRVGWRAKAAVIGAVLFALCALTVFLSLLFGRELRRRAAMQVELARQSRTDTLTGLANRRRFEQASGTAWRAALRSGKPLSLLLVDADHFKRFNDHYGHAVGDEVLKGLARCLAASVNRPGDLVARIGGEEFAVLLPGKDGDGALRVAETIHRAVATLAVPSAAIGAGTVTVSIGQAVEAGPGGGMEDLYRRADAALYEAKADGRNRTRRAEAPQARPAHGGGLKAA